jgi:hypothetical protein
VDLGGEWLGLAMGAAAEPIFAELHAMLHEAAEGVHRGSRARVASMG